MSIITQNDLAIHEKVQAPLTQKSNFAYSFSFLPKEERSAINSIYAFCSYIDDIVDGTPNINSKSIVKKLDRLAWWENEIEKAYLGNNDTYYLKQFNKLIQRFDIPKQYFFTLIDGVRRDLIQHRYQTFEELKDYCYSVASVVGLISIEIFGYKYEETKNYAINLGYALQLTNILRDIAVDKERGYIYIPKEDLIKFEYSEEDIINAVYNENFIELMRFQTGRAREYYYKARTSLRPDEKPTIVAAEIMDSIYYRLLEKIELERYDVYSQRVKVSTVHKAMLTAKKWLSMKMFIQRFLKDKMK
ncbi:MAG TPA: squalene/phytoene synthase family protein [Candidatus Kapabacteria bacterium]|nr:squalene/phytoene synthase family protein [Candidatus Kapabacteria bacterium]